MNKFGFKIIDKSKKTQARTGLIQTAHGAIETPTFVTVATNAAVKGGVDVEDLKKMKAQTVLANTYHLLAREQVPVVKKAGGLGKFMNFTGPTWTDSGGYQVFSLGQRLEEGVGKFANYDIDDKKRIHKPKKKLVKITEKGAEFRSHLNGLLMYLSPEDSMRIQSDLGADIIFAFDVPTSPITSHQTTKQAMDRTHRWAKRCLASHQKTQARKSAPNKRQVLFGIVQGGPYDDLRTESAKYIASLDFPGFGIGGSYHRPNKAAKFAELESVIPHLPDEKPRHFLGIGGVEDILVAVQQGIDTFDCVMPTREARHGRLYKFQNTNFKSQINSNQFLNPKNNFYEFINITNAKYRFNYKPINNSSLKDYSYAYLHHLFKTQELLGIRLATINNLDFYFQLMSKIRQAIKQGKF